MSLDAAGMTRAACLPTAGILIAISLCGCDLLNPDRQLKTQDRPVNLIAPSAEVDSLLSHQRVQDEEVERFWREPHSRDEGIASPGVANEPRALLPWTCQFPSGYG
jgi:hypothetical protein